MRGWNRSVVVALLTISVAACGGSDGADSSAPATTALSTTTAPVSDQLFVVDQSELEVSATNITEVTRKLADSFNGFDQEAAAPLAGPGFRAIDPVYPGLGFSSITAYYSYLSGLFDSSETVREIVVNADGSLTRVDWPTFFRTEPAGFDGPLKSSRHLLIDDGQVIQLMHLFEQDDARLYAEPISKMIPFASIGIPLDKSVEDINAQADAATDLSSRWSAAWTAHDPMAVEALYTETGVRHDEYAGPPRAPADVGVWATRLFAAYPDLTVTVDEAFGSGVGPAMLADLTVTENGASCTVRVGVVWTIDSDRYIEREDVYYDPATLVTCGWVR